MEFQKIFEYVKTSFGIDLAAYKSKQLVRRVENFMARVGAKSEVEFINMLKKDPAMSKKFQDHLTINVSEFFRNKEMFLQLEKEIKSRLHPEKSTLKIWSAACSYGAEPYTLAIIMDKLTKDKKHTILATDIDLTIFQKAKEGKYVKSDVKNVDSNILDKYFQKKDENYYISEDIKKRVNFKRHDLIVDRYDSGFDLIVCRNVVIYFTQDAKRKIYEKFFDALNPGGLLFVGATESIYNYREIGFEKAATFIYKKPGGK